MVLGDYDPDAHPYGNTDKGKKKRVRTVEGAKKYGQPIGTIITLDMEEVAKFGDKSIPGYHLLHPKGSTGATIARAIFDKHGQDSVVPLYPAAMTAFKSGHPLNKSIDIAAAVSGKKQVTVYVKGNPAGYLPPGAEVYVGKVFSTRPKDANVAYGKSGDDYYSIAPSGIGKMSPQIAPSLQGAIDDGTFVKVPYAYGDLPKDKPNTPSTPDIAPDTTKKGVSITVGDKKVGDAPAGSEVYVSSALVDAGLEAKTSNAYVKYPDGSWHGYSPSAPNGVSLQGDLVKALQRDAAAGYLSKLDNLDEPDTSDNEGTPPTLDVKKADPTAVGKETPVEKPVDSGTADEPFPSEETTESPSTDLKDASGKPILPPKGMQPGQSTLQKPAPAKPISTEPSNAPKSVASVSTKKEGGGKKFEVLPDPGSSGDGYFATSDGSKLWGKYGSAGVMVRTTDKESGEEKFLLVQRGPIVSSNKGKWQLPGGALNSNEDDYQGTARELTEELGPPDEWVGTLKPKGEVLFNHPSGWHYNNIVADAPETFEPEVDGEETGDAKWFTYEEVLALDLHPALKGNIGAIFEKFGGPEGSDSDESTDAKTDGEKFGDVAVNTSEPDAVDAALNPDPVPEQEKTLPKQVYVLGKVVGEVPADSKILIFKDFVDNPNTADHVYVLHKDGTGELFNTTEKISTSQTLINHLNKAVNEGTYVNIDNANAQKEMNDAVDPNLPNKLATVDDENSVVDVEEPWGAAEKTDDPFNAPAPAAPPEDTSPKKDVYLQGKKVGEVSEDAILYTEPEFLNKPKESEYIYAKNTDGTLIVFDSETPEGREISKGANIEGIINDDLEGGYVAKIIDYDANDGTDSDISPVSTSLNTPSSAKIDVGGVQVNSKEIADAITALKNGQSWQIKVHLKNNPLHKMDYLSVAKKENDESGVVYPTKEAVIRALEKKFKKLPATDAEEAAVEQSVKDLDEQDKPKTEVEVGGITVNKNQLQGAIALIESGPSPYPKVNLKGHLLHNIDMPDIMWKESKKGDESTKSVLLRHLKKKLKQFHEDELTGKSFVDPPKEDITPVKGLAQLDKEANEKKDSPGHAAQSNLVTIKGDLMLKPGVYMKLGGYSAKIIVEPNGKLYYHGSKKTEKLSITGAKAHNLYNNGFTHYVGPPEAPTAGEDDPNNEVNNPSTSGGPVPGKYFALTEGFSYQIFNDGSAMLTTPGGASHTVAVKGVMDAINNGEIYDKYGTSITPPGMKAKDFANFRVFGSKGMSLDGLKKMREDVAKAPIASTMITESYKVKGDLFLDYMTANKSHGGIKNTALAKIDEMIHAIETKQTSNPNDIGLEINDDAKKASGIFKFNSSGYATSEVLQPLSVENKSDAAMRAHIKDISQAHGGAVGAHGEGFTQEALKGWLKNWYKGDMKGVFDYDDAYSLNDDEVMNHPGHPNNKGTHKIVWAPAVPGEVPAGVAVNPLGGMLDPQAEWPTKSVNAYLVAANTQNTEYMSPTVKAQWAMAHANKEKLTVDSLSLIIKKMADEPSISPQHSSASLNTAQGPIADNKKSYAGFVDNKTSPHSWTTAALNDYLEDHGLYNPGTNMDKADVVYDYFEGKKTVDVNGTVVRGVPLDSVIYYDPNTSKVYVKHNDGTFTKFGTHMSGDGVLVIGAVSLSQINAGIATEGYLPWKGDKTKNPIATTLPTGPAMLSVAGGKSVEVDPLAEIWAFHNKKGEVNGFYTKFPSGKITYNSSTNDYQGKNNVSKSKFDIYKADGKVTQIPNPASVPTSAIPEPVVEKPVYEILNNSGLKLGNNQQTTNVSDQFGKTYVFKPYSDSEMFRAEAEHGANLLSRKFGFATSKSQIVEIDGKKGQLQDKHAAVSDFTGIGKEDISKFTQQQLNDLAKEHLLDWQLENPDARQLNILQLNDGSIVGIDKGMFGKHYGQWEGLQPNSKAHMYEGIVPTKLFDGIRDGLYTQPQIDDMYKSVMYKARDMERVSDADLHPILIESMENNSFRDGEEFAKQFLERKNRLREDMDILWGRVYAMTDFNKPELKYETVNPQGHVLHSGFTGDHTAAAAKTKSYGTAAFFSGTDVEDMHAVTWRERLHGTEGYSVRGEFKVRGSRVKELENWLSSRSVSVGLNTTQSTPPKPTPHLKEQLWHSTILTAAGNIAYHSDDGNYNESKIQAMEMTKKELNQLLSDNESNPPDSTEATKIAAQNQMAQLYLGYIKEIETNKSAGIKPSKDKVVRYTYIEPPKSKDSLEKEIQKPVIKVEKRQAARAKNVSPGHSGSKIALAEDGEMVVDPNDMHGSSEGNGGQMYVVTLPTGEQIEFRGIQTQTAKTNQGLTRYTIPPTENPEVSLERIKNQLHEMGLDLKPAEETDYELYYWRHLANIMRERKDSKPGTTKYKKFWDAHVAELENTNNEDEVNMWRNAFATITNKKQIDQWVSDGNHLPQFLHHDIRNKDAATGKPWWKRFDVTEEEIEESDFLIMQSSNEHYPSSVVNTGGSHSTEGRMRSFGAWMTGGVTMSSSSDQGRGSSSFVFTRQGMTDTYVESTAVVLAKHVSARSHTYAYKQDGHGDIDYKDTKAHFNYPHSVSSSFHNNETSNEMMIKDGVSLLDDIELVYFNSKLEHEKALAFLRSHGITTIRGVPIEMRLILVGVNYSSMSSEKKDAIKKLREFYKNAKKK